MFMELGAILGIFIPIAIFVGVIVFSVALCLCLCRLCRKKCGKGQQRQTVTTVVYAPPPLQQPPHAGYHPFYPDYHPVPVHLVHGGPPEPTAPPPSYMEATEPALSSFVFSSGQPMYPHPSQPNAQLPTHSDEHIQLPYNPGCCLTSEPLVVATTSLLF